MNTLSKHLTRRRLPKGQPTSNELQEMCRNWFDSPLGKQVLLSESELLNRHLARMFGYHILQLGCSAAHSLIDDSPVGHKIIFSPSIELASSAAVADNEELPLASDSIDVVVIHHALDFSHDRHRLLREATRVLRPGGHLLVIGFNPLSLWGISKLVRIGAGMPWNGRFISRGRVSDWLKLLELHVEKTEHCLHFWPSKWKRVLSSAARLEQLGAKFKSPFGGVYLMVSTKQVLPLTPIFPRWNPLRARPTAMPAADNLRIKNLH